MKILKANINWFQDCDNLPVLEIEINRLPQVEMVMHPDNINYGENNGRVHFRRGQWSSRPSEMNQLGYGPCVSAHIIDRNSWLSGAITLDLAQQAAEMAGVKLTKVIWDNGEFTWVPAHPDCPDELLFVWSGRNREALLQIKKGNYFREGQAK